MTKAESSGIALAASILALLAIASCEVPSSKFTDQIQEVTSRVDARIASLERTITVAVPGAMYQDLLLKAHSGGPDAEAAKKTVASMFKLSVAELDATWDLAVIAENENGATSLTKVALGQSMGNTDAEFDKLVRDQQLRPYSFQSVGTRDSTDDEAKAARREAFRRAIEAIAGGYEPGAMHEPGRVTGGLANLVCISGAVQAPYPVQSQRCIEAFMKYQPPGDAGFDPAPQVRAELMDSALSALEEATTLARPKIPYEPFNTVLFPWSNLHGQFLAVAIRKSDIEAGTRLRFLLHKAGDPSSPMRLTKWQWINRGALTKQDDGSEKVSRRIPYLEEAEEDEYVWGFVNVLGVPTG